MSERSSPQKSHLITYKSMVITINYYMMFNYIQETSYMYLTFHGVLLCSIYRAWLLSKSYSSQGEGSLEVVTTGRKLVVAFSADTFFQKKPYFLMYFRQNTTIVHFDSCHGDR